MSGAGRPPSKPWEGFVPTPSGPSRTSSNCSTTRTGRFSRTPPRPWQRSVPTPRTAIRPLTALLNDKTRESVGSAGRPHQGPGEDQSWDQSGSSPRALPIISSRPARSQVPQAAAATLGKIGPRGQGGRSRPSSHCSRLEIGRFGRAHQGPGQDRFRGQTAVPLLIELLQDQNWWTRQSTPPPPWGTWGSRPGRPFQLLPACSRTRMPRFGGPLKAFCKR